MNWGVASICAVALVVGAWTYWHKDAPKFTTFLFLVGGIGFGGALGKWIGDHLSQALGTVGTTTGTLIGLSTSAIVAAIGLVATLEVVVKGMHPKRAKPKRWHPWLALALPLIVTATGVPVITQLMHAFASGVGNVGSALSNLGLGG